MSYMSGLEKQLNLLDYALSSLWRRRLKSGAILFVFAAVIFLLGSFQMVTQALTDHGRDLLAQSPDITLQKMTAGRQESIPLAYRNKLDDIFGIRRVVPRIWGYYFDEVQEANYTVMGLDVKRMPKASRLGLALESGTLPGKSDRNGVVVGSSVRDILNLAERPVFSFFRPDLTLKPLKMTGVFSAETDILTHDLVLMSLDGARDLFHLPADSVTDLALYVANKNEIDTIAKRVSEMLPDTRVVTRTQVQKTYQVVFGWRSGFASICLLTALAAFVILAWDKASGLSPEEKKEIGILKILGWETTDVLTVRFWESLIISGLAFVIGCTLAYIHVVFFDASIFRPVLMGWSVIYPNLRLIPDLAVGDILLIFAFSVLPYLAATVIPAWRSASVPADSVLGG